MALDVGCGVGGPARTIAAFTGCKVIGLNNNDYQLERAKFHTDRAHMSTQLSFCKADFMNMPLEPNTFDGAYSIEATCHAPHIQGTVFGTRLLATPLESPNWTLQVSTNRYSAF